MVKAASLQEDIPEDVVEDDPEEKGKFDYRSVLRKRTYDPAKTLRKAPEEIDPSPVDYRSVLKKRSGDPEEDKNKKQVLFPSTH